AGTVGTLNLIGTAELSNGILNNDGTIDVSGAGNELLAETVTNSQTIEVLAGGALTIDANSIVNNAGTLSANGGTLIVSGDVSGAGSATISGGGTLDLGGAYKQTVT